MNFWNYQLKSSKYDMDIVAADSPYLINLRRLVERLKNQGRVNFASGEDDLTLVARYRRARALISPSCEEGFGIISIEPMNCGTPIVASDITVHREVYGDAAICISLYIGKNTYRQIGVMAHCLYPLITIFYNSI